MNKEEEIAFLENSVKDANLKLDSLDAEIKKLKDKYSMLKYETNDLKSKLESLKNRPEMGDEVIYTVETCKRGCCYYSWRGSVKSISDDYKLYDVLNYETNKIQKNISISDLSKASIFERIS